MESQVEEQCVRCRRGAPDVTSTAFLEWDYVREGDSVICPDCLTENEETYAAITTLLGSRWPNTAYENLYAAKGT